MAYSRKKSCTHCRAAKARCDILVPACSRCISRRLECCYEDVDSVHHYPARDIWPYPSKRPVDVLQETSSSLGAFSNVAQIDFDESMFRPLQDQSIAPKNVDFGGFPPVINQTRLSTVTLPLTEGPYFGIYASSHLSDETASRGLIWPREPFSLIIFLQGSIASGINPHLGWPLGSLGLDTHGGILETSADEFLASSTNEASRNDALTGRPGLLTERKAATMEHWLTAMSMLGTFQSYPAMMCDGVQSPPFIHPCIHGMDAGEAGAHNINYPEPLAICAGLVQMHNTKTIGNNDYVWRTIHLEQQRLHSEVCLFCFKTTAPSKVLPQAKT